EKREKPLTVQGQLELGQEIIKADEDYQIYMGRIDDIGYDAAGRMSLSEDQAHEPPQVKETIIDFVQKLGW
ncbi:MAG: hypothetical protein ACKPCP_34730, partial [Sphaerospermopsis kisseleviana]